MKETMREGKSKRNQKQNTKMQKKNKKSFKKQTTTSSNFYTIYEYILM